MTTVREIIRMIGEHNMARTSGGIKGRSGDPNCEIQVFLRNEYIAAKTEPSLNEDVVGFRRRMIALPSWRIENSMEALIADGWMDRYDEEEYQNLYLDHLTSVENPRPKELQMVGQALPFIGLQPGPQQRLEDWYNSKLDVSI